MAYSNNRFFYRNTPKIILIIFILIIVIMIKSFFNNNNNEDTSIEKTKTKTIDTTEVINKYLELNCNPRAGVFNIKDTILTKDSVKYIIKTTLDPILQKLGDIYMGRYHPIYGAVVVTDAITGEIKGLMSYSNPDSCDFELANNFIPFDPRFPTASTFKTITLYSYLSKQNTSINDQFEFPGKSTTLYTYQLQKEKSTRYRYRIFSIKKAYGLSANPVFGEIGIKLGKSKIFNDSKKFLFNTKINLDLFNLQKSNLLSIDSTFNLAELGSGFNKYTTASPLQASLIFTPLINSGYIPQPKLIKSITSIDSSNNYTMNWSYNKNIIKISNKFSKKGLKGVKEGTKYVVKKGTARRATQRLKRLLIKYPNWEIGGKTGNVDGLIYRGRTDWFIGYFSNKKLNIYYTISVMQVHGPLWNMHSSFIASEIMRRFIRDREKELKNKKDEKKNNLVEK